jgi:hypothetical protein
MKLNLVLPTAAMAFLVLCSSSLAAAPQTEALFNGRNLEGWRCYLADHQVGLEDVWSVRDGLLICRGEPMGYLYTSRSFTNFKLVVEWRWAPGAKPGNSGVLLRINGAPKPLPRSLEAQLQSGNAGDFYGFHGMTIQGAADRLRTVAGHALGGDLTGVRKITGNEKEPGEWNRYEIELNGGQLKAWVNGQLVNEATDCEILAGPIGLQSEGGEIHFRKVELTRLPGAKTAAGKWLSLFNGKDLEGWIPKVTGYELGENPGNMFRVVDGLLTVSFDGFEKFEGQFGHLFYEQPFSDYILRLEYRFIGEQLAGGPGWAFRNSGAMLHGQPPETMVKNQDFPVSIEMQLLGGSGSGERSTANLCTPGTHVVMDGKLLTQHCTNSKSKTYHGDQWVTVEIAVHGNRLIEHRIDGEVVLAYSEPQLDPGDADARRLLEAEQDRMLHGGSISLQAESHPLQFRKVELLPLQP